MNYASIFREALLITIDYRKMWLARLHRLEGLLIGFFIYLFVATTMKGFEIIFDFNFVLSIGAFYMLGASVNMLNQILDREADKLSTPKIPNTRNILKEVSLKNATIHLLVTTLALIILLIIIGNKAVLTLFAIGYLIAYIYSAKPLRIKGIPLLGILANSYGGMLLPLVIYFLFGANFEITLLLVVVMFFTWMMMFIVNEMLDYTADKKYGDKTTALFLGIKKSAWLAFIFSLSVCVCLILLTFLYNFVILILIGNVLFTGELFKLTRNANDKYLRKILPKMALYSLPFYMIYLIILGVPHLLKLFL
ncbi:TPA: UbiA prenyltransferase family protein [archaeon]|uniref:UbiA prenyltransferase family protein n=1 Tax=Candidatus Naiadarchaeum limnaeum TaxID=2756139 RepID=A0A832V0N9_9ARCH|nr:UbiA prenyltransferase family protein [Candidatus Naiadarchaeales archaeon SRR2090153.bin1042]HIJ99935.1 UbiA prenyltransferase family protein [Candidatus Naiadarchaeum limnaeum]